MNLLGTLRFFKHKFVGIERKIDFELNHVQSNVVLLFGPQDFNIEILRPEEEYDITLHMVKLEINLPLDANKFVLEKPQGAQEIHLDGQPVSMGGGTH